MSAFELCSTKLGRRPVVIEVLPLWNHVSDTSLLNTKEMLTRRRYEGTNVLSTSASGVGENTVGFASAAVAIIVECAPLGAI